ncbi:MAG: helix-turn-helix domain-containing protein [Actinomycetota bacterium]
MDMIHPIEALIPGAQGKLLSVLTRAGSPLSLRTLADLANVSPAQVSRLLPSLIELGIVEKSEVPPSILLRLVPQNLVSKSLLELLEMKDTLIAALKERTKAIGPPPINLTLFGSIVRGQVTAGSDIDVLVIRPSAVDDENSAWWISLGDWVDEARTLSGNRINLLEVAEEEVRTLMRSNRPPWNSISEEGIMLAGKPLNQI